jgi:hypothetical protein
VKPVTGPLVTGVGGAAPVRAVAAGFLRICTTTGFLLLVLATVAGAGAAGADLVGATGTITGTAGLVIDAIAAADTTAALLFGAAMAAAALAERGTAGNGGCGTGGATTGAVGMGMP